MKNEFPEAGFVTLQNHHRTDVVLFTNIKIKELDLRPPDAILTAPC
ncbi:MAG: hypothetical protein JXR73_06640 [Candidatus Omnitrophica bacterium]|nr:hypothetical protein [Candidatus Omnitrophota bacterium]